VHVKEVVVQYRLRRIRGAKREVPTHVSTPLEAATLLNPVIGRELVEVAAVLCLSVRNELLAYHELSRGTLDSTIVSPRDVFRTALVANAATVIVGHNHPSGDPAPSIEDVALTRRLAAAGEVIGVTVADHLIVTFHGAYFSFMEAGRM
jgi:DNA repair protein RadC